MPRQHSTRRSSGGGPLTILRRGYKRHVNSIPQREHGASWAASREKTPILSSPKRSTTTTLNCCIGALSTTSLSYCGSRAGRKPYGRRRDPSTRTSTLEVLHYLLLATATGDEHPSRTISHHDDFTRVEKCDRERHDRFAHMDCRVLHGPIPS